MVQGLKKKILWVFIVSATLALLCVTGLASCSESGTHTHSYVTSVISPTCGEQGYTLHKCKCGKEYKDNYVDATDEHSFTNYIYDNNANCTYDGTETATCSKCNKTDTRIKVGSRNGTHNYEEYFCKYCHITQEGAPFTEGLGFGGAIAYNVNGYLVHYGYGVSGGAATSNSIIIPKYFNRMPVIGIGQYAFAGRSDITSITIPDSVIAIAFTTFMGCDNLIQTENGVQYVDKWVVGCDAPLTSVVLRPDTVGIAMGAFMGHTELKSIVIPDKVRSICSTAFMGCSSLTSITIPNSVTNIGNYAFWDCSSLTSITIGNGVSDISFGVFTGCDKIIQTENGVQYVDKWAIGCDTSITSVVLRPDTVGIAYGAFSDCNSLTSVTIPDSVKVIGENAFLGCSNLSSIAIGSGVSTIFYNSFWDCDKLTNISVQSANSTYYVSGNCIIEKASKTLVVGFENSVIPADGSVLRIGKFAFFNCGNLTNIHIPRSIVSIEPGALAASSLTIYCEVEEKPNGWYDMWNALCPVVWDCNNNDLDEEGYAYTVVDGIRYRLKNGEATVIRQPSNVGGIVVIPSSISYNNDSYSVTSIGAHAFSEFSGLTSVEMPNSVTSIGSYAFNGCISLTSVTIPNSVTSIGSYAFYGCSSLTGVTISNSVKVIGESAFSSGRGYGMSVWMIELDIDFLTVYCEANEKPGGWHEEWTSCPVVWDCNNNDKDEDGYAYTVFDGVKYSLKDGMATVIGQPLGLGTADVVIPVSVTYTNETYSVTNILGCAFFGCSNLTNISIPNSVTSIGRGVFYGCSSLTNITFVGTVDEWAAVLKDSDWDRGLGDYTVTCNGDTI